MQQSMAGFLSFVGTNLTFTVVAVFQLHRPYLSMYVSRSTEELQPERQNKRNSFRPKEFWLLNLRSFRSFVRSKMRYKPSSQFLHKSGTETVYQKGCQLCCMTRLTFNFPIKFPFLLDRRRGPSRGGQNILINITHPFGLDFVGLFFCSSPRKISFRPHHGN